MVDDGQGPAGRVGQPGGALFLAPAARQPTSESSVQVNHPALLPPDTLPSSNAVGRIRIIPRDIGVFKYCRRLKSFPFSDLKNKDYSKSLFFAMFML
jgi:hypothetical protein